MNSYNKRLFFKTITRQTKIISIVLLIFCALSFGNPPIKLPNEFQNLLLLLVLVGAISLLNSNTPSVKLRVYEYKLKLLSNRQLKKLLALKVTYYSLVIFIIVSNLKFFTGTQFYLFEWFYLIICIKNIIIREINLVDKLKIIGYSFLVIFPVISIYILWGGVIIFFIYSERIDPDYESMEKMTYYLDNAFSSEFNEQDLLPTTYDKKNSYIKNSNEYIKLKEKTLIVKIIYLSIAMIAIAIVFNVYEIQNYLFITLYGITYIFAHQVFEQWIYEEMRVRKSKLYPKKKINNIIMKQCFVFLILMMIVAVLTAIGLGEVSFIVMSLLTLIYILVTECYLELSFVYNIISNIIFFGIITFLYYV